MFKVLSYTIIRCMIQLYIHLDVQAMEVKSDDYRLFANFSG